MVYLLLLPYALFRWGSGREVVIGSADHARPHRHLGRWSSTARPGDAVGGLRRPVLATCALGAAVRYRASARMRELDQVKLLERERLARDLHDTVAHHVSAMAIRAQAGLATSATRPGRRDRRAARDRGRGVARARRDARDGPRAAPRRAGATWRPSPRSPTSNGSPAATGTGPPVDVEVVGDLDDLPAAVGTAIYRLAQESVTNARRHARHATRIEVRVAADDTSVRLRVSDDGDAGPCARPRHRATASSA